MEKNDTQADVNSPVVLGVLSDLFFGVKIADAAVRAGGQMHFIKSEEQFMSMAAKAPALVVFDLHERKPDAMDLLCKLKADAALAEIPTVAFFSHVQEELRREALALGCDAVLPRSVFTERAEELVGGAVRRALASPPQM